MVRSRTHFEGRMTFANTLYVGCEGLRNKCPGFGTPAFYWGGENLEEQVRRKSKTQEFSFRGEVGWTNCTRKSDVRKETGHARSEFWREAGDKNLGVSSVEKVVKPRAGWDLRVSVRSREAIWDLGIFIFSDWEEKEESKQKKKMSSSLAAFNFFTSTRSIDLFSQSIN